jgi:hypothetical protein
MRSVDLSAIAFILHLCLLPTNSPARIGLCICRCEGVLHMLGHLSPSTPHPTSQNYPR